MTNSIDTVTAVYHGVRPAHLSEALRSLADQTFKPERCIVVADGPLTPELESVLAEYQELLPIRILRLTSHGGSGPAKQIGLEAAESNVVAIADADDISRPDRLEKQFRLMQDSRADLIGAAMLEFDGESGEIWGVRAFPVLHDDIASLLRKTNPINHPTACVRRSSALDAGGYADLPYLEDYDLWARMLAHGSRLGNHDEPLVWFRGGVASLARRRAVGITSSEWRLQRNLVSYGINPYPRAGWNMVSRTAFRLLPHWLMRRAYRRLFLSSHGQ